MTLKGSKIFAYDDGSLTVHVQSLGGDFDNKTEPCEVLLDVFDAVDANELLIGL